MYLELDQRNIRELVDQLLVDADYERLHLLLQCPTLNLSVLKLFVESAVSKFQKKLSRETIGAKSAQSAENGAE